jgi:hypothetical protein
MILNLILHQYSENVNLRSLSPSKDVSLPSSPKALVSLIAAREQHQPESQCDFGEGEDKEENTNSIPQCSNCGYSGPT